MPSFPPPFEMRFARALLHRYRTRARYTADQIRAAVNPPSPTAASVTTGCHPPSQQLLLADPTIPFRAMGWQADPWQTEYLKDDHPRQALLCCRRAGKSVASAAKTLVHCSTATCRNALALVFSPTMRQSIEYARYVRQFADATAGHFAGKPPAKIVRATLTGIEWANGSRLLCMPDSHRGVVGFTPTRIVIDEASRVSDVLYLSLRPMLALGAALEVLSTPFGKRGWFFEIFNSKERLARFHSWRVAAEQCPRIPPEFLDEERLELGERWFAQEYHLAFNDAVDAEFTTDVIEAAMGVTADGPLFALGA